MALVKFGGGITEMRGSIAGNVFARNKYCAYVRARTKPINRNSELQNNIRDTMGECRNLWFNTCDEGQRLAWATYAANVNMKNKLGETIQLSGYNHFVRSNSVRLYYGLAAVLPGPTVFSLPAADDSFACSGTVDDQKVEITWDNAKVWATETGAYLFFYLGLPKDVTINFFGGPYRKLGRIVGKAEAETSPFLFAAPFTLGAAQKIWCRARISRADGRLSEFFRDEGVVAAA